MSKQTSHGVLYVAYGDPARRECTFSLISLADHMRDALVSVISNRPLFNDQPKPWPHVSTITMPDDVTDPGARRRKLASVTLSPFEATLYLDADTRIHGSLAPLFELLDHWPMILTYSVRQGEDVLGNCSPEDRGATFSALGTRDVLGLQCGVLGFRKNDPRVRRLFAAWSDEWEQFKDRDQAAFLRALHREPLPIHLLGRDWNGGAIIEHRYGHAARPRKAA